MSRQPDPERRLHGLAGHAAHLLRIAASVRANIAGAGLPAPRTRSEPSALTWPAFCSPSFGTQVAWRR